MRRNTIVVIAILLGAMIASAVFANTYTGTMTVSNGISGTGEWVNNNGKTGWFPASLTWNISDANTNSGTWHYDYVLSVSRGDVSHFILEVPSAFTTNDIASPNGNFQGIELGDYSSSNGNSNPNMPGTIHGIKFDNASGTTWHLSFNTPFQPAWGDFYSKSGHSTVWNLGLSVHDIDPVSAAANGVFANHILVPGMGMPSGVSPIPEPSGMLSVISGLIGLVCLKRKK